MRRSTKQSNKVARVVEDPNDPDSQAGIENSKFKIPDGLISARLSSFQISTLRSFTIQKERRSQAVD